MGEQREVDTLLVGDQAPGNWLLVFLDSAREALSPQQARQITEALTALNLATQGETDLNHLFADLAEREPTLPPHLQSAPDDPASGV
jgi:hydrogenase expression/formation protein HypC